jgi:hypothetical protein
MHNLSHGSKINNTAVGTARMQVIGDVILTEDKNKTNRKIK